MATSFPEPFAATSCSFPPAYPSLHAFECIITALQELPVLAMRASRLAEIGADTGTGGFMEIEQDLHCFRQELLEWNTRVTANRIRCRNYAF